MWVMTFHSACARILRAEAERLGYTRGFTIYDEADSRRLVKRCLDELGDRPQALHAARDQVADLARQEPAVDADAYREQVGSFFEETVADVYDALRAAACTR